MTAFSGSFVGKARLQTTLSLFDIANHELNLIEVRGLQKSTDPGWHGSTVTYWGLADLQAGSGSQRGYYVNERADGDRDWGTFEGKITAFGEQVTMEGTWTFAGGTGKFNGIGGGSYRGRMTSPGEVEMEWAGEYQLAGAKVAGASAALP
jgi:hypothetical protein